MGEKITLTIAIPTYNRTQKLLRLLYILKEEIRAYDLSAKVSVLISDNSDSNDTAENFARFLPEETDISYHKQEANIGFDRNISFLYKTAKGDHTWFMSDDDHPFPGSLAKIVSLLDTKDPDVLLFSFMQPPGSTNRQFNYPEAIHEVSSPAEAIRDAIKIPKISIYVLKKIIFTPEQEELHAARVGDGWMFLEHTLSVLDAVPSPKMLILSEQMAGCDEDYNHIWVPTPFLWLHKVGRHPYVKKHLPELENELRDKGYMQCIMFSWALARGKLVLDDTEGLKKFIRNLDWRFPFLVRHPKLFVMLFLMKTRVVP